MTAPRASKYFNRISTRGPALGACNICGIVGRLTEDHTPPKGCYRPTQVEMQALIRKLADSAIGPESRWSQNGVKYRTICHRCNNTLLGGRYDKPLIEFVNSVATVLNSSIMLPPLLAVSGQPQAIARSVIGHLSAQGVDRFLKGPLTNAVRDYFVDESLPLPDGLNVHYWAYPYRTHVMARDAGYLDLRTGTTFVMWFMKFFPIGFMVTWDEVPRLPYATHSLSPWRDVPYEHVADLPLGLAGVPPEHWPEAPTDTSVVALGREAINVRTRPSEAQSARVQVRRPIEAERLGPPES